MPTMVETMRGSLSENWRAAAASGTPNSWQAPCIALARSTISFGAVRFVAGVGVGALGEDAAAIGGGVERGHAALGGDVE
jgi:hypothetical protein